MSAGWEIGDLALCVRGGSGIERDAFKLGGRGFSEAWDGQVIKGAVYTVRAIRSTDDGLGLGFLEIEGPWQATRFRKIKPDAHDDCELEFVTLLNRIKRPAKQGEVA